MTQQQMVQQIHKQSSQKSKSKSKPKPKPKTNTKTFKINTNQYKITEKITKGVINEIVNVKNTKGLTPENVVEAAKDKSSELHTCFDWNDSSAGTKYRLQQARLLINDVIVIVNTKEYYAFENVAVKDEDEYINEDGKSSNKTARKYLSRDEILNKNEFRNQILRRAVQSIEYWQNQYSSYNLHELKPIFKSIQELKGELDKKLKN